MTISFQSSSDGTYGTISVNGVEKLRVDSSGALIGGVSAQKMLLIPAKATTSGTFVDFSPADGTGIPSWAKKVTVILAGISTNGTSQLLLQLGTASGVEATGYAGTTGYNATYVANSTGANLDTASSASAATIRTGGIVFTTMGINKWVYEGVIGLESAAASMYIAGQKTLAGVLDRVRITTVGGTDTFDLGSIAILCEGY